MINVLMTCSSQCGMVPDAERPPTAEVLLVDGSSVFKQDLECRGLSNVEIPSMQTLVHWTKNQWPAASSFNLLYTAPK